MEGITVAGMIPGTMDTADMDMVVADIAMVSMTDITAA